MTSSRTEAALPASVRLPDRLAFGTRGARRRDRRVAGRRTARGMGGRAGRHGQPATHERRQRSDPAQPDRLGRLVVPGHRPGRLPRRAARRWLPRLRVPAALAGPHPLPVVAVARPRRPRSRWSWPTSCSWSACSMLVRLGEKVVGPERAALGAILLAIFPFSAVFSMAYAESLFLCLSAGAFLAAERDRRSLAGILVGLAAADRLQGAVLALPIWLVLFLRDGRRLRRSQAWLLLGPLAAAAFLGRRVDPSPGAPARTAPLRPPGVERASAARRRTPRWSACCRWSTSIQLVTLARRRCSCSSSCGPTGYRCPMGC